MAPLLWSWLISPAQASDKTETLINNLRLVLFSNCRLWLMDRMDSSSAAVPVSTQEWCMLATTGPYAVQVLMSCL